MLSSNLYRKFAPETYTKIFRLKKAIMIAEFTLQDLRTKYDAIESQIEQLGRFL